MNFIKLQQLPLWYRCVRFCLISVFFLKKVPM